MIVRLDHVTKAFGPAIAVDEVSLDVNEGEILGVIGYSGAGKSTLVRLINGLERPTSGGVRVGEVQLEAVPERKIREVRKNIGMVFQQFNLLRSRTVAGNVAYPLEVAGVPRAERDARVARLLDFVGLLDRAHAYPEQLSGGQKQRVGIARALATEPRILLADEATSALDPETTAEVLRLLHRVNREIGVTIVLITHEMAAVAQIADRVAVMEAGRVVEEGELYEVVANPRSDATSRFLRTALHDRPDAEALERIRSRYPGRIVSFPVRDRPGLTSTIHRVLAEQGVEAELVFGGISEVGTRPVGSLSYELRGRGGADGAVDAALAVLAANGIDHVEEAAA